MARPSETKAEMRKHLIAQRDAMPAAEREALAVALAKAVESQPEFRAASSVLATLAIGSEWNTRPLLERARAAGKRVVLPRVSPPPRRLELYEVADFATDLKPGVWNIPEPDPERCKRVQLADIDFALVPALAVDREGYRLGYGAGYFDGLLAGRGARPLCVIALPSDRIVESLPHEGHDVPVDRILDEAGRATAVRKPA
jgi:5-formyltetrahydrofolate cyclo-ligase